MMSEEPVAAGSIEDAATEPPAHAPCDGNALPRAVRHDLRSSVGQVIGYTELWIDSLDESDAAIDPQALRHDLDRVLTAGKRILQIVNESIDPVGPRARAEMGDPTP